MCEKGKVSFVKDTTFWQPCCSLWLVITGSGWHFHKMRAAYCQRRYTLKAKTFFFFLYFKKDSWPYRAFHLQFDFLKLYGRRRNNISHVRVSSNWLLENELWRFNSAWIGNMLWRMWLISCTSHSENDFSSQLFFLPCVLDNLQVFFGFNFFSL